MFILHSAFYSDYHKKVLLRPFNRPLTFLQHYITLFSEYTYSDISIDIILQIKKEESCFLSIIHKHLQPAVFYVKNI